MTYPIPNEELRGLTPAEMAAIYFCGKCGEKMSPDGVHFLSMRNETVLYCDKCFPLNEC